MSDQPSTGARLLTGIKGRVSGVSQAAKEKISEYDLRVAENRTQAKALTVLAVAVGVGYLFYKLYAYIASKVTQSKSDVIQKLLKKPFAHLQKADTKLRMSVRKAPSGESNIVALDAFPNSSVWHFAKTSKEDVFRVVLGKRCNEDANSHCLVSDEAGAPLSIRPVEDLSPTFVPSASSGDSWEIRPIEGTQHFFLRNLAHQRDLEENNDVLTLEFV